MDTLKLLDKIREEVNDGDALMSLRDALRARNMPTGDWTSDELYINFASVWVSVVGTLMPVFSTDLTEVVERRRRDDEIEKHVRQFIQNPLSWFVRRPKDSITFVVTAVLHFNEQSVVNRLFPEYCKPTGSQKLVAKVRDAICDAVGNCDSSRSLTDILGARLIGPSGEVSCFIASTEMELDESETSFRYRLGLTTLE